MHAVSMELEIFGRRRHPNLTLPFLKVIFEKHFFGIDVDFSVLIHIFMNKLPKDNGEVLMLSYAGCIMNLCTWGFIP